MTAGGGSRRPRVKAQKLARPATASSGGAGAGVGGRAAKEQQRPAGSGGAGAAGEQRRNGLHGAVEIPAKCRLHGAPWVPDVLETDQLRHEQPQKYKQVEFQNGPIHPVLEKLRRELVEFHNSNGSLHSEASEMEEIRQEPEELDRCLLVDFSALLACRERFVEEIRQKRRLRPRKKGRRPKRKSLRPKNKGSVLLGKFGLPSWLFAEADDDPLATRGATTDLSDSNCEEDEEEDKNGDKKEVLLSCPVQKCDLENVEVISESRFDMWLSLMEENHQEFFSGKGIGERIRPLPLLALPNVTRPCILTRTCYHCRYRTDDITETDVSHRELEPENMVQIFSLTLPRTYPHSISIYGIFAVRDVLHPGRNYLFKRSRDNPVTIHPGSSLPLCNPCRGIYALDHALLDVDLQIKHEGDDESADEEFIAGYFELVVCCNFDIRFRHRLHDGIHSSHFLDIDYRYIGWSIAATVIASADVSHPCRLTLTAYTSGFDDEVMIFDDTCCGEDIQFRHVVAVKMMGKLELCLKLDGLCFSLFQGWN